MNWNDHPYYIPKYVRLCLYFLFVKVVIRDLKSSQNTPRPVPGKNFKRSRSTGKEHDAGINTQHSVSLLILLFINKRYAC